MAKRQMVEATTPWAPVIGYSRAVRIGDVIAVSGTSGLAPGEDPGGPYEQALRALKTAEQALAELGAELSDVVRTRFFVTDISLWREIGRAHAEVFGELLPASSMFQVGPMVAAEMLVEVEMDAVVVGGA